MQGSGTRFLLIMDRLPQGVQVYPKATHCISLHLPHAVQLDTGGTVSMEDDHPSLQLLQVWCRQIEGGSVSTHIADGDGGHVPTVQSTNSETGTPYLLDPISLTSPPLLLA